MAVVWFRSRKFIGAENENCYHPFYAIGYTHHCNDVIRSRSSPIVGIKQFKLPYTRYFIASKTRWLLG